MSVLDFLNKLPQAFNTGAAADTRMVLQFQTSQPAYATIANGACNITAGSAPKPDVTLIMEDDDLIQLLKGELNGMMAFMTGKLRIEGDMAMAQRISSLFDRAKLA